MFSLCEFIKTWNNEACKSKNCQNTERMRPELLIENWDLLAISTIQRARFFDHAIALEHGK